MGSIAGEIPILPITRKGLEVDTRTGDIYMGEQFTEFRKHMEQVNQASKEYISTKLDINVLPEANKAELIATGHTKISRNDQCPCGSGKKFKKCCLNTRTNTQHITFPETRRDPVTGKRNSK